MDLTAFGVGALSGIIVGLATGGVLGWLGHRLSLKRSSDERRLADETERIERCRQVFAARVDYVVARHRGSGYSQLRQERQSLERRYPDEMPEEFLKGTPEWETYIAIERVVWAERATMPSDERIKRIEQASPPVHRLLADRRAAARR